MKKTLKLKMVVNVEYKLNGESPSTMKQYLDDGVHHLADSGLFTQYCAAEVKTWDYTIKEQK